MQQHIDQYCSTVLYEALQVSRSGYHAWRNRPINVEALCAMPLPLATPGTPYIAADMCIVVQGRCISVRMRP